MVAHEDGARSGQGRNEDALELLRRDHRNVDRMFEDFPRATVEQRDTLFEEIKHELDAHAAVEEELFYPALRATGGRGAELVEQAGLEHFGMKTLLGAIAHMQPSDPGYAAQVEELREDVRAHVAEEESEIFRLAREVLGPERLRELGTRMAERKVALREEMSDIAP
jgi:iron-sulfur cluster repair protein YtfE (RIC family)